MTDKNALVVHQSGPLAPRKPQSLAVSKEDVAATLEVLLPVAPEQSHSLGELKKFVEDAASVLAEALPWVKLGWKIWKRGQQREKKEAAKRQFQKLIILYLRHLLTPGNSKLADARSVIIVGGLHGIEVSYDLAAKVLDYMPEVLKLPALRKLFDENAQGLLLNYAQQRFDIARLWDEDADLHLQMKIAEATANAVAILREKREAKHWQGILAAIASVCRSYLTNQGSSVDANYMVPHSPSNELWKRCSQSTDAVRIFEEGEFRTANEVLCIDHAMVHNHINFWVPVFNDVNRNTPGAAIAFADRVPQVVYTKLHNEFRAGVNAALQDRIADYFDGVGFKVFLSLPVIDNYRVIGIVNVNLHDEEIKFLFDEKQIQRLYAAVTPLLAVLAAL